LDIIFKTKQDWTEEQNEECVPRRRDPRKGFPDYGGFGRFEWLIRSAFIWLVIGLFLIGLWIFYYIMKPVLAHTKNN